MHFKLLLKTLQLILLSSLLLNKFMISAGIKPSIKGQYHQVTRSHSALLKLCFYSAFKSFIKDLLGWINDVIASQRSNRSGLGKVVTAVVKTGWFKQGREGGRKGGKEGGGEKGRKGRREEGRKGGREGGSGSGRLVTHLVGKGAGEKKNLLTLLAAMKTFGAQERW